MLEVSITLFFTFLVLGYHAVSPLPYVWTIICSCAALMVFLWSVSSKWISYSVFLIFLGGMMVVFLYASILSSNEKLIFKIQPSKALLASPVLTIILFPSLEYSHPLTISKMYSNMFLSVTLFLILYLLMVLFMVVKLAEPSKGSLSKKF